MITHRSMVGRASRNFSPTHPLLAPVRSRPSLALGTCPVRQLAAPRPTRGGLEKQNNAARKITRGHQAALRSAPLRLELARLPSILHYTTLDRAQPAHLRYTAFRSVTSFPLSRYFPEVYRKAEITSPPTRPPLAPSVLAPRA